MSIQYVLYIGKTFREKRIVKVWFIFWNLKLSVEYYNEKEKCDFLFVNFFEIPEILWNFEIFELTDHPYKEKINFKWVTDISIACRTFCSENRLGEMFWILTELKQLLYYIWIECSDYSSTIAIIVIRVCKIVQK